MMRREPCSMEANFGFDWSWDTRHLLVEAYLPNGGVHLMIVDVVDGHHRELVHLQSGDIGRAVFSPDGHYIAYETWQTTRDRATPCASL